MEQENTKISLNIDEDNASKRLDLYLYQQYPSYSRTFFKNLIQDKLLSINGKMIDKPSYITKYEDLIQFSFPKLEPLIESNIDNIRDLNLDVRVLYAHQDFLIVYKPANLTVHKPSTNSKEITLVDWLVCHFKELEKVGDLERPGIVHRLDKDTSGILIIPRNNQAHIVFSNMFKERKIEKTYIAVVKGHPVSSSDFNKIDKKIRRDIAQRNKMAADYTTGRDSVTYYKVQKYLTDASVLEVKPITGRTHQIRVHLSSINHPIIGDELYGSKSKLISRQALHAYRLSFNYKDIDYVFWYDIPSDIKTLIDQL